MRRSICLILPMLTDCCLNGRGRSAEDVAEDRCVFLFVYTGTAFESLPTGKP